MANDSDKILSYLPHRPPFVMVSDLINATENHFETEFFIQAENILVEDQMFTEAGLIENIAQTCACGFGYLDQLKGKEAKIGYIGSISKLIVYLLPPVNSRIYTKTEVTYKLGNIYVIKGEIFLEGKKLLECEMKIVAQSAKPGH